MNTTLQTLQIELANNPSKKFVVATQNAQDALNNAASPSSANPVSTINDVDASAITPTTAAISGTTDSSSSTTGSLTSAGGLGVAKNATIAGQLVAKKNIVNALTPYTAGTDTTAGWTLAEVKTALVAGAFKTTSAAAVTLTLDSVANIITSFAAANVTLTTGSVIEFYVDNSQGANTVTVAVDGGATIAVATPVITGGATLTVSTANKVGRFQLYLTSATTGILSRIV